MMNPFEIINKRLLDIQCQLIDLKYTSSFNNSGNQPSLKAQGNKPNSTKQKSSKSKEVPVG